MRCHKAIYKHHGVANSVDRDVFDDTYRYQRDANSHSLQHHVLHPHKECSFEEVRQGWEQATQQTFDSHGNLYGMYVVKPIMRRLLVVQRTACTQTTPPMLTLDRTVIRSYRRPRVLNTFGSRICLLTVTILDHMRERAASPLLRPRLRRSLPQKRLGRIQKVRY